MEKRKAHFRFSAFADEITPDLDGQLEALKRLEIPLLELRGVDGKSFTLLTDAEADEVERAVERVLDEGYRTADILGDGVGCKKIGCREMGTRIAQAVRDAKG